MSPTKPESGHENEAPVLPTDGMLTTEQAVEMLGMSSLLGFMQRDYAERRAALDELSRETYELGLT